MRSKRIILKNQTSCYHVMSHLCGGERYLNDYEKEVLRKQIWNTVFYSGLELLTYCIMDNHFHLLVRVPDKLDFSDKELLSRYRRLYPKPNKYQVKGVCILEDSLKMGGEEAQNARDHILKGMGDLSMCIKLIKQRYSIWYNRRHDRKGTLWSDRFKSVLVENSLDALKILAAYIDLNPVRAGLVDKPENYRFCTYAEVIAGKKEAIIAFKAMFFTNDLKWVLRDYRVILFGKASRRKISDGSGNIIDYKLVKNELRNGGKMEAYQVLRCRIRYFTDGYILGSQAFLDNQKSCRNNDLNYQDRKENKFDGIEGFNFYVLKKLRVGIL